MATGIIGSTGIRGIQGFRGNIGHIGNRGDAGIAGDAGSNGITGATGSIGRSGIQGLQGSRGFQGFGGNEGITGNRGYLGNSGGVGFQGTQGIRGFRGISGYQGIQGNLGIQGNVGIEGVIGVQGDIGIQGDVGNQGLQGRQGFQGEPNNQEPQIFFLESPFSAEEYLVTANSPLFSIEISESGTYYFDIQVYSTDDVILTGLGNSFGGTNLWSEHISLTADQIYEVSVQQDCNIRGWMFSGFLINSGSVGESGYQGREGMSNNGSTGPIGFYGNRGNQGYQGQSGYSGTQGPSGIMTGYIGFQGDIGVIGEEGYSGYQGQSNNVGFKGIQGQMGIQGEIGPDEGSQGPQGPQGTIGLQGDIQQIPENTTNIVAAGLIGNGGGITFTGGNRVFYNTGDIFGEGGTILNYNYNGSISDNRIMYEDGWYFVTLVVTLRLLLNITIQPIITDHDYNIVRTLPTKILLPHDRSGNRTSIWSDIIHFNNGETIEFIIDNNLTAQIGGVIAYLSTFKLSNSDAENIIGYEGKRGPSITDSDIDATPVSFSVKYVNGLPTIEFNMGDCFSNDVGFLTTYQGLYQFIVSGNVPTDVEIFINDVKAFETSETMLASNIFYLEEGDIVTLVTNELDLVFSGYLISSITGPQGLQGFDGLEGIIGVDGTGGVQGPQGFQGAIGGTLDKQLGFSVFKDATETLTEGQSYFEDATTVNYNEGNVWKSEGYFQAPSDDIYHFQVTKKPQAQLSSVHNSVALSLKQGDIVDTVITENTTLETGQLSGFKLDTGYQGFQGIPGTKGTQGIPLPPIGETPIAFNIIMESEDPLPISFSSFFEIGTPVVNQNIGNAWADDHFVAPVQGMYHFDFYALYPEVPDELSAFAIPFNIDVLKNGQIIYNSMPVSGNYQREKIIRWSQTILLNKDDVIDIFSRYSINFASGYEYAITTWHFSGFYFDKGITGSQGPQGIHGSDAVYIGLTGPQGTRGTQGPAGNPQGFQGIQGFQGTQGNAGTIETSTNTYVSQILTVDNLNLGAQGNPALVNEIRIPYTGSLRAQGKWGIGVQNNQQYAYPYIKSSGEWTLTPSLTNTITNIGPPNGGFSGLLMIYIKFPYTAPWNEVLHSQCTWVGHVLNSSNQTMVLDQIEFFSQSSEPIVSVVSTNVIQIQTTAPALISWTFLGSV